MSDDLSLFEEELSLQEPLPKHYVGGEEVQIDGTHLDARTPKTRCAGGETQTSSTPSSSRDFKPAIKEEPVPTPRKRFQLIIFGSKTWRSNASTIAI